MFEVISITAFIAWMILVFLLVTDIDDPQSLIKRLSPKDHYKVTRNILYGILSLLTLPFIVTLSIKVPPFAS